MNVPFSVSRTYIGEVLDVGYKSFIHAYTDGSVDRCHGAAIACCYTPAFRVTLEFRINVSTSTLAVQLCRTGLALLHFTTIALCRVKMVQNNYATVVPVFWILNSWHFIQKLAILNSHYQWHRILPARGTL